MLLKKLIFLMLPLILVYWRSRAAQDATRWIFRGVIPSDGPFGRVVTELRTPPVDPKPASTSTTVPGRDRKKAAARLADNWPVIVAFIAGLCIAAALFSRGAASN